MIKNFKIRVNENAYDTMNNENLKFFFDYENLEVYSDIPDLARRKRKRSFMLPNQTTDVKKFCCAPELVDDVIESYLLFCYELSFRKNLKDNVPELTVKSAKEAENVILNSFIKRFKDGTKISVKFDTSFCTKFEDNVIEFRNGMMYANVYDDKDCFFVKTAVPISSEFRSMLYRLEESVYNCVEKNMEEVDYKEHGSPLYRHTYDYDDVLAEFNHDEMSAWIRKINLLLKWYEGNRLEEVLRLNGLDEFIVHRV